MLQQKLGNVGSVGMGQAMKLKWITLDKSSGQAMVKRKVLVYRVTCLLMMMYAYSTMFHCAGKRDHRWRATGSAEHCCRQS